ncbi:asparaginase [Rhodovibrionaceae bacterium A322]
MATAQTSSAVSASAVKNTTGAGHFTQSRTPNLMADNPVLVEVTRGNFVECQHRAAVVVCDAEGKVVMSAGAVEQLVYGRSAIKPLQALALVESGAADAYGCSVSEIALSCASHNGEDRHAEAVQAWLERIGLSVEDLECGPQFPTYEPHFLDYVRAGGVADRLHNNCSGKHAGFLTTALHMGVPTKGYITYDHPVQQSILGILEMMTGLDLREAPRGIDGCGIPQLAMPLGNMALAMARMTDPSDQPDRRQLACKRVLDAMGQDPFMVAGSDRACTKIMTATKGRALVKTGAEGVFCGALPDLGLGIALKVDDGATRASNYLIGRVLDKLELFDSDARAELQTLLAPLIYNREGVEVGQIQAAADCPF